MNYKHIYHAGNFADVFKHLTLIFCLEKLRQKDSAFLIIDTHAGIAKYDLQTQEALKTNEAFMGIKNFLQNCDSQDFLVKEYLSILFRINSGADIKTNLKFYPGSPYIIKYFLRDIDRAIFAEINKIEYQQLRKNIIGAKNTEYLNENGFDLLRSKLPPIERRGLILIDPAFEKNHDQISKDYNNIIQSLTDAAKRFAHGVYLVWHPIINKENEQKILQEFYQKMSSLKFNKMIHLILIDQKNENSKMNACGLFIINAPWGIEEKLKSIFSNNLQINHIIHE